MSILCENRSICICVSLHRGTYSGLRISDLRNVDSMLLQTQFS